MASVRKHVLKTLDVLQALGEAAIEAADAGDGRRSATLMLDLRDVAREEQAWVRSVAPAPASRNERVLAKYRLGLAQVEVLVGRIVEPYPDFDAAATRRAGEALIALLTLRIDAERLEG